MTGARGTFDAVYFVRPIPESATLERRSAELRYSLRSLEANFTGLRDVHILGGLPTWLNRDEAHWHRGGKVLDQVNANLLERWGSVKHLNTWAQWVAIAELARHQMLSERFVIMNDDFFIMERLAELPNEHRGPVGEWMSARQYAGQLSSAGALGTSVELVERLWGVPRDEQVAYETHGPLTVNRDSFAAVVGLVAERYVAERGGRRLAKRSLYGNAVRLPAELAVDAKVHDPSGRPRGEARYLSSTDESFWYGSKANQIGGLVRARFSTPSRFER